MKEKMLVLGIAEPHKSRKYEVAICVAGITTHGEFRRIYSVPISHYICRPFKKFQYIRYETVGKGDGRPESRKADYGSIEPLDFASSSTVSEKIRNNTSPSLDYLRQRSKISLGIVKPAQIRSCQAERQCKRKTGRYTRLRGKTSNPICLLPFWMKIQFLCRPNCNSHSIMWEDMEIGNYYRKLLLNHDSQTATKKTEERAITFLNEFTPYFLVGTHILYRNVWLIISTINQQAEHFYSYLHF
jgi:hypothetical protein